MLPSPESIKIVTLAIPIALFGVGFFKKPIYAVLGYFCLVYFKTSAYYPAIAAMQGELVFAAATFVIILLHGASLVKLAPSYNPVNKYLYLFTVCVGVSYLVALDTEWSWFYAVYHYIKVLILYVMVMLTLNEEQDLKIMTWGLVLMYVYMTYEPLYGFLYDVGGSKQGYGMVYTTDLGILSGHVALANNMNQMIPIAFFLFLSQKERSLKLIALATLLIFLGSLIASKSRGGFVGFVAFAGLLIYYLRDNKKLMAFAVPGIAAVFLLSATLLYTASRIGTRQVEGRLIGFAQGIEMVRIKHNFLGVGPGCFRIARGRYFGHSMDAHNLYGELIGELGIPGTIMWALLMWSVYKNLKYVREKEKSDQTRKADRYLYYLSTGFLISLIVRLIVGMGSHGLYFFYWYILGAISIVCVKLSEKEPVEESVDERNTVRSYRRAGRGIRRYDGYRKNS